MAIRVSARSSRPPRFQDRVVVLHRQCLRRGRPSLRLRADLLPPGNHAAGRARSERLALYRRRSEVRALRDHRRREGAISLFEQKMSRGAFGEAGFDDGQTSRLDRQLDAQHESRRGLRSQRRPSEAGTIHLHLRPTKPPVIHGENGVSVKATGGGTLRIIIPSRACRRPARLS